VAAQAALDSAEEEYSTMQRQLNANRAGLLAKDLQKGKPCPVCGSILLEKGNKLVCSKEGCGFVKEKEKEENGQG